MHYTECSAILSQLHEVTPEDILSEKRRMKWTLSIVHLLWWAQLSRSPIYT
jgi:hypothetical protein